MGNGSGVSRGDGNRNARLERLRARVPVTNAIAGIDLAGSKQMVVVADHDWKGHRAADVPVRGLGIWARRWTGLLAALRRRAGAGVTVSCEPAGHRWRLLGQLAAGRPVPLVCVQPLATSWARRTEDLTCD